MSQTVTMTESMNTEKKSRKKVVDSTVESLVDPKVEKKSRKKVVETQVEAPIVEKKSRKKVVETQEPVVEEPIVEKKSRKKVVETQEPVVEKKSRKKVVETQEPVVEEPIVEKKSRKKVVETQEPVVEPIVEKKSRKKVIETQVETKEDNVEKKSRKKVEPVELQVEKKPSKKPVELVSVNHVLELESKNVVNMNNVVQELKTLMKDNMDHNNTIFEDFDKNFLEIKKTDTFEMIFGFEDTLYKLYDKYESSIQKMHNIQMMINNVRDILLENISPVMSTDKLLEKYKLFFVQYALKMQNGKQNFEHDIPNKVDILCKKLHVLMEKTDDAPDKDSVYKLDNSAKKHLINLENSDNEDSDSDSDKQKTLDTKPAKGKKVVKMVQRDSDSE